MGEWDEVKRIMHRIETLNREREERAAGLWDAIYETTKRTGVTDAKKGMEPRYSGDYIDHAYIEGYTQGIEELGKKDAEGEGPLPRRDVSLEFRAVYFRAIGHQDFTSSYKRSVEEIPAQYHSAYWEGMHASKRETVYMILVLLPLSLACWWGMVRFGPHSACCIGLPLFLFGLACMVGCAVEFNNLLKWEELVARTDEKLT